MTASDRALAAYDCHAVARALAIGASSTAAERTIDITTRGARSGAPRGVEVWFHRRVVQLAETAVPLPAVAFADGLLLFAQAGRRCYWSV